MLKIEKTIIEITGSRVGKVDQDGGISYDAWKTGAYKNMSHQMTNQLDQVPGDGRGSVHTQPGTMKNNGMKVRSSVQNPPTGKHGAGGANTNGDTKSQTASGGGGFFGGLFGSPQTAQPQVQSDSADESPVKMDNVQLALMDKGKDEQIKDLQMKVANLERMLIELPDKIVASLNREKAV